MQKRTVATYAANGKRLRDHTEAHVLELEKRAVVVLSRRKGRILVCQFRTALGANPVRKTAQLGTQYSFYSRVGNSHLWQHKRLVPLQDVEALFGLPVEADADVDIYLRAIFRAVPLSVMRPPKVVSIESGRKAA